MIKGAPDDGATASWHPSRRHVVDLDPATKQIIGLLQQDGRRPFAEVAAEVGLAEHEVEARVGRLVEQGVLLFTAVTDPLELGFAREAMLGIGVDPARLREVTAALAALPEVTYLVSTAGGFDLIAEVIGDSDAHLLEIVTRKVKAVPGVSTVHTYLYLRTEKQVYDWGVR